MFTVNNCLNVGAPLRSAIATRRISTNTTTGSVSSMRLKGVVRVSLIHQILNATSAQMVIIHATDRVGYAEGCLTRRLS